jgi:hypothetical protein
LPFNDSQISLGAMMILHITDSLYKAMAKSDLLVTAEKWLLPIQTMRLL